MKANTQAGLEAQRRGNAALGDLEILHIRRRAAAGISVRTLANEYHIGFETVRRIIRGETYSWVGEPVAKPLVPGSVEESLENALALELTPEALASAERVMATQARMQAQAAYKQELSSSAQPADLPVGYVAPSLKGEGNDEQMLEKLSQLKNIPLKELQHGYAGCGDSREAIRVYFNALLKSKPRDSSRIEEILG